MSIALEAKVDALERRVIELELVVNADSQMAGNFAEEVLRRLAALEQARKPGPKPKDASNG
jgi:hypothetical protein